MFIYVKSKVNQYLYNLKGNLILMESDGDSDRGDRDDGCDNDWNDDDIMFSFVDGLSALCSIGSYWFPLDVHFWLIDLFIRMWVVISLIVVDTSY